MQEIRTEFPREARLFVSEYLEARLEAQWSLGEHFPKSDCPVNIQDRFSYEWRFLVLDVPGKGKILSTEIYEKKKQQFQDIMEETRGLAICRFATLLYG